MRVEEICNAVLCMFSLICMICIVELFAVVMYCIICNSFCLDFVLSKFSCMKFIGSGNVFVFHGLLILGLIVVCALVFFQMKVKGINYCKIGMDLQA